MFEQIPTRQEWLPTQRTALAVFSLGLAFILIMMAVAALRWVRPLSTIHQVALAQMIVCALLSGIFLLAAKSASQRANRNRIATLYFVFFGFQVLHSLL